MPAPTPIEHVGIVVKENHGLDNYFGTFPSANGMAMAHGPNPPRKDPDHRHPAWLTRATTAPRVAVKNMATQAMSFGDAMWSDTATIENCTDR